jgi:hypothetical protein
MYVNIESNTELESDTDEWNTSIEHGETNSFDFKITSTGLDPVTNINISYSEENITVGSSAIPSSWVSINNTFVTGLSTSQYENINVNISVPENYPYGNYSGRIVINNSNANTLYINMTVEVPLNTSWYVSPSSNHSYNKSVPLSTAGEVGNFTVFNIGNTNLSFTIAYIPTPGANTSYEDYGPALFEENSPAGYNPTQLNVSKGENGTISLWQKGFLNEPKLDVGITLQFSSESATPNYTTLRDGFDVEEQPPEVGNIWFIDGSTYGNIAEVNKNLTIKVQGIDDFKLEQNYTILNVTYSSVTNQYNVTASLSFGESSANKKYWNYTIGYVPSVAGIYYVQAMVRDTSGDYGNSSVYNFTAYGSTSMTLAQNVTYVNATDIYGDAGESFYVNYSFNNTGYVTAYYLSLNFTKTSSIVVNNVSLGNLSGGYNSSSVVEINVSSGTSPGVYNVTAILRYENPDGSSGSDSEVLSINVSSNKNFSVIPTTINSGVLSGESNYTIITIENTGNDGIENVNISCISGSLCSGISVSTNDTGFNISGGGIVYVNLSYSASAGTDLHKQFHPH